MGQAAKSLNIFQLEGVLTTYLHFISIFDLTGSHHFGARGFEAKLLNSSLQAPNIRNIKKTKQIVNNTSILGLNPSK